MWRKLSFLIALVVLLAACELSNDLNDATTESQTVQPGDEGSIPLLNGAYDGLRNYQSQDQYLVLSEHTADGLAAPTRGPDWDDAGKWRALHLHTWAPTHPDMTNQFNAISANSFDAQNVICNEATGELLAQAIFLRAFNDYHLLDNFGMFQRRECGTSLLDPPQLIQRSVGADQLIEELEGILTSLPATGAPKIATIDAARALLMKLYLNKAVWSSSNISETGVTEALEGPYSFDANDMTQVVNLADAIMSNGYALATSYYDNFDVDNSETSSELIFVSENTEGGASGNVRSRHYMGQHYNQSPSGWNGFVALSDLYNLYDEGDARLNGGIAEGASYNIGFQIGQQFDVDGNPLNDRNGNPLVFTPEFSIQESGSNLEVTGIRTTKYVPDLPDVGSSDNDYVFFRLADIMLMKAEAILRGGSSSDNALDILNAIRARSGAAAIASVDLDEVLDERHRELWHEGWRRNDLIRFNRFLSAWQEKPVTTNERLIFPIPSEALSVNPNLVQNFGY